MPHVIQAMENPIKFDAMVDKWRGAGWSRLVVSCITCKMAHMISRQDKKVNFDAPVVGGWRLV